MSNTGKDVKRFSENLGKKFALGFGKFARYTKSASILRYEKKVFCQRLSEIIKEDVLEKIYQYFCGINISILHLDF